MTKKRTLPEFNIHGRDQKHRIAIGFDKEMFGAIRSLAESNRLNFNQQVRRLVAAALKEEKA